MSQQYLTIGFIRAQLGYDSRLGMQKSWQLVFPGQLLPDDNIVIDRRLLTVYLLEMQKPKKGRSATIGNSARELLDQITEVIPEPQAETEQPKPVNESTENKKESWFSLLDLAFYANMGIAIYGLVVILGIMGVLIGVFYTLISIHAIGLARDRYAANTSGASIGAVVVLEIFTYFIHLAMFNASIWKGSETLPFQIMEAGEWRVFAIACVLAFVLTAGTIYAITVRNAQIKERIAAKEFEKTTGQMYY